MILTRLSIFLFLFLLLLILHFRSCAFPLRTDLSPTHLTSEITEENLSLNIQRFCWKQNLPYSRKTLKIWSLFKCILPCLREMNSDAWRFLASLASTFQTSWLSKGAGIMRWWVLNNHSRKWSTWAHGASFGENGNANGCLRGWRTRAISSRHVIIQP